LLEKGHDIVRKGKVVYKTGARPHIEAAFFQTQQEFVEELKNIRILVNE
jgi:hypothetical protein